VDDDALLRCRDLVSGHELLLRARELRQNGLRVELHAYGSRVLLDWRAVPRDDRPWDELARTLPAEGVPDLERALWALAVRPAQQALEAALADAADPAAALLAAFDALVPEAERRLTWSATRSRAARERLAARIEALHGLIGGRSGGAHGPAAFPAERAATEAWLLLEGCGAAFAPPADEPGSAPSTGGLRLFDELSLREAIARAARARGAEGETAWRLAARVRALLAHPQAAGRRATREQWRALLADEYALYATGLTDDSPMAKAPAWLGIPARLEELIPERG